VQLLQSTITLLHGMAASYARTYVEYWAEASHPNSTQPQHLPQTAS
jgi:hypothetical protein